MVSHHRALDETAIRELTPEALAFFVFLFYWQRRPTTSGYGPSTGGSHHSLCCCFVVGRGCMHPYLQRGLTIGFAGLAAGSIGFIWSTSRRSIPKHKPSRRCWKRWNRRRTYALMFDTSSAVVDGPAYLHFVQYHQLRKGGVSVYSFAEAPQSPIRFVSRKEGGPPPTSLRSEWKAHEFKFNTDARYYNYFLTRGGHGISRRARFPRGEVSEIAKSGSWRLFGTLGSV